MATWRMRDAELRLFSSSDCVTACLYECECLVCVCVWVWVWAPKSSYINHNIQLENKSKMEVHNSFDF